MKKFFKSLLFPPLPATITIAVVGFGLIIAVAALPNEPPALQYIAYFASAYALTVTITGLRFAGEIFRKTKKSVSESRLAGKVRSTGFGGKYLSDAGFRTQVSLWVGFAVSVLYIAVNFYLGLRYRSYWYASIGVYYLLLAGMRFTLLYERKGLTDKAARQIEILRKYKLCGIALLLMNQALAVIVLFIVQQNEGFNYRGNLIYAMAAYSFYAVILAIVNLVKSRKYESPLISAARMIRLVAALVSILALTTALITRFGNNDEEFRRIMTMAVGSGVCAVTIILAIVTLAKAHRMHREFYANYEKNS